MALYLSPIANDQQMDANGDPLVGGKIYTYLAGSTTPVATYTDSAGGTSQANPIILNSLGISASPIWLTGGVSYKFVIKDSADVTLRTIDGIAGINDVSSTAQEWNESGLVPTYISATQFSVPGDQTALLQVNRRLRCDVTAGFAYGRISVSSFAAGITTVTVVNDSTPLDSGLSSVAYGFLSYSPSSVPYALYAEAGANATITSLGGLTSPVSEVRRIQPISASVSGNALTISASSLSLEFRSSTLGSGAVSFVKGTPANLVISSGSTLGTVNGQQSDIIVLAINNAGTIELAAVNIAGGNDLSETGLISTTAEGGAGGADSANVIYSTTARTNVAYQVIGLVRSTQATAGTWATAPSLVQGAGGRALGAMQSLGYGQTWQIVTRTSGTTYYNTTGKPIVVCVSLTATGAASATVGGVLVWNLTNAGTLGAMTFTVPPGSSYSYSGNSGQVTELR